MSKDTKTSYTVLNFIYLHHPAAAPILSHRLITWNILGMSRPPCWSSLFWQHWKATCDESIPVSPGDQLPCSGTGTQSQTSPRPFTPSTPPLFARFGEGSVSNRVGRRLSGVSNPQIASLHVYHRQHKNVASSFCFVHLSSSTNLQNMWCQKPQLIEKIPLWLTGSDFPKFKHVVCYIQDRTTRPVRYILYFSQ